MVDDALNFSQSLHVTPLMSEKWGGREFYSVSAPVQAFNLYPLPKPMVKYMNNV